VATGTYSDNSTQIITNAVTWSSSNTDMATISNASGTNGQAQGTGVGGTTITASLGTVTSNAATLSVAAVTLASITIDPNPGAVPQGTSRNFTALGHYTDGSSADLTTSVTWLSSDTSIFTVSNANGSQGLVRWVSDGTITLYAVLGTVTGTAIVTPCPGTNGWTQVGGHCQYQYTVSASQLLSQENACNNGSYFQTAYPGPSWGFIWTDVAGGLTSVTAVNVTVNQGTNCSVCNGSSPVESVQLNGADVASYTSNGSCSTCTCGPTPTPVTFSIPPASLSTYSLNGSNSILIGDSGGCCTNGDDGMMFDGSGYYAYVTVTY
jgi:hypothetical protein